MAPLLTVVAPVFLDTSVGLDTSSTPDFFVASRAHHADIGGTTPGSMPPFSRTIEEEGALFELFQLVTANELHEILGTTDRPLNELSERELCPGSKMLGAINSSLR